MLNKAIIDLHTIKENAIAIKKLINGQGKFCAVVKSDAYGHGAVKVSNAIYPIVDSYAVATCEEGIQLRLAGIDKDILVLIPPQKQDLPGAIIFGLTFSAFTKDQIDLIGDSAEKLGFKSKVHIKFDTGMNRLGVRGLDQLKELTEYSLGKEGIILDGAYSHLGELQNKKALKSSVDKFLLANNLIKGYNNINCHISASGGLLSGIKSDIYRVGILLYGYMPIKSGKIKVRPAMKIYSPILDKKMVNKGQRILYGDLTLQHDESATLVQYGYADGLERAKKVNLLNNRCMNISAYSSIKEQDGYALILEDADRLAKENGTISYEILTKSAITAQKIYLN